MFASLSRFRRHVAVLSALALVASLLAAAPLAADEHPEMELHGYFQRLRRCGVGGIRRCSRGSFQRRVD